MYSLPEIIKASVFMQLAEQFPVIDVRSPGEFSQGHIPGAFNVPLFDNDERARIGTTYVQIGKEPAIELGLKFAGVKTDFYLKQIADINSQKTILLHCWRGGMRSSKIALFYAEHNFKVYVLEGGYKAYRQYIRSQFSVNRSMLLIGGYTGSGKTEILRNVYNLGHQVIDLESLACHKGSAFGHLGQKQQPTTEQFENDLFAQWNATQALKPLWVEHESKNIGNIFLPETFHKAMLSGVLFQIQVSIKTRIARLVHEYACFEDGKLFEILDHLSIFMGSYQVSEARKALKVQDYEKVAAISLQYYDKLYDNSMLKRPVRRVIPVDLQSVPESQFHEMIVRKALSENLL